MTIDTKLIDQLQKARGYHRGERSAQRADQSHFGGHTRNGKSQKTLKGDFGELELETPRDRQATFEPKIVAKGQTR
jgi:transposase-like protein